MKFDFGHNLELYIEMLEFNIDFIILSIDSLDDKGDYIQFKIYNKYYYDGLCLSSVIGERMLSIAKLKNKLVIEFSNNHNLFINLENSDNTALSFIESIDNKSKALTESSRIIILKKIELLFSYLIKERANSKVNKIIDKMIFKGYSNTKIADILDLDEEYIRSYSLRK